MGKYSLIETGAFELECSYDPKTYHPQQFFINGVLVTQEDLIDDFAWDYDVEHVRREIRDFEIDNAGYDEPLTFRSTGCVRRVA